MNEETERLDHDDEDPRPPELVLVTGFPACNTASLRNCTLNSGILRYS